MKIYDSTPGEPRQQKQWIIRNRTMGKLERNQTRRIWKIYQNIFDHLHIYSTKINSKNYQKGMNGITR